MCFTLAASVMHALCDLIVLCAVMHDLLKVLASAVTTDILCTHVWGEDVMTCYVTVTEVCK